MSQNVNYGSFKNLVNSSIQNKRELYLKPSSPIDFLMIVLITLGIIGFIILYNPTNLNVKNSLNVQGQLNVQNGNLEVTGDGDLTGSVKAEYITLPDYASRAETYLWADRDTLLWQSGIIGSIPPRESDVFGWAPKLAQTSIVNKLPTTATTQDIISRYNDLLQLLYSRGIIFANPRPALQVVRAYNVLTSAHVTTPDTNDDINDNVPFNNNGNIIPIVPRKQMAHGYFLFSNFGITNVNQIQSIQVNFYAKVYRGSNNFSDARIGLQLDDSAQLFYDYANQTAPNDRFTDDDSFISIGCNVSSGEVSSETNPSQDTGDLYISDLSLLKRWFCDPQVTTGTLIDRYDFDANWFIGYPGHYLKRCRFTRFVINYFATS